MSKDQDKKYYVYIHRRLDNETVFYIGKGCDGRKDDPNRGPSHQAIIYYLQKNGYQWRSEIIADSLTEEEAYRTECKEIYRYVFDLGYGIDIDGFRKDPALPYLTNRKFEQLQRNDKYTYPEYHGKIHRTNAKKKNCNPPHPKGYDLYSEAGISHEAYINIINWLANVLYEKTGLDLYKISKVFGEEYEIGENLEDVMDAYFKYKTGRGSIEISTSRSALKTLLDVIHLDNDKIGKLVRMAILNFEEYDGQSSTCILHKMTAPIAITQYVDDIDKLSININTTIVVPFAYNFLDINRNDVTWIMK